MTDKQLWHWGHSFGIESAKIGKVMIRKFEDVLAEVRRKAG